MLISNNLYIWSQDYKKLDTKSHFRLNKVILHRDRTNISGSLPINKELCQTEKGLTLNNIKHDPYATTKWVYCNKHPNEWHNLTFVGLSVLRQARPKFIRFITSVAWVPFCSRMFSHILSQISWASCFM